MFPPPPPSSRTAARRPGRGLVWAAVAALLLATALVGWLGLAVLPVRGYARLAEDEIDVRRDPIDSDLLIVSYRPASAGTISLRRADGGEPAEMTHQVSTDEVGREQELPWRLGGLSAGQTVRITYRNGWSAATVAKTVPEEAAGLDAPRDKGRKVAPDGDEPPTDKPIRTQGLELYALRTQQDRPQWITKLGGSTISEQSVEDGLNWLARHQAVNGSWFNGCLGKHADSRCEKPSPCGGPGITVEMAHSGLALLAFQAGGHYYFNGTKYSDVVRKGLDWLVAHQKENGALIGSNSGSGPGSYNRDYMYEHGIATFALADACATAEALGQPAEPRYREALKKAVQFIETNQHRDGGWRYSDHLQAMSDTSVTGWPVLALKSAKEAGLPISGPCVAEVRKYFASRATGWNGRTGYGKNRAMVTDATTGVGMLARQFLLGEPDAPIVKDAAKYLADMAEKEWGGRHVGPSDYYLWYNCTLAMFQAGGETWKKWNSIVRDVIIKLQRHEGCERGSWDPSDRWGPTGGRIYSTALAILTLEVYYRYAARSQSGGGAVELPAAGPPGGQPAAGEKIELPAEEPVVKVPADDARARPLDRKPRDDSKTKKAKKPKAKSRKAAYGP